MTYKELDMNEYSRRGQFEYFNSMDDPILSITVQLDITYWFRELKKAKAPFFLSFLYAVGKAANSIPEFRQRIRDSSIIEYASCDSSYTFAVLDGSYRYCRVRTEQSFDEFLIEAKKAQEAALMETALTEDEDPESCFFISCLPKTSYTELKMPCAAEHKSVPNIVWGKYYERTCVELLDGKPCFDTKIFIPITVSVDHALADGVHISEFFAKLEDTLASFSTLYQ